MKSIFFDSEIIGHDDEGNPIYDRPNDASDLRKSFKSFIGNGVYANPATEFQVVQGIGMAVNAMPGRTWIEGAFAWEEEVRELIVQASEAQDRIDRVVLRLDLSNSKRDIDLYVLKGLAALVPVAPPLTRNDTVHERALADLFIAKNSTSISQQRITDTRLDSELCGIVTGVIDQIDTSTFYDQIQADLADFKANAEGGFTAWSDEQKAIYESWTTEQKAIYAAWTIVQKDDFAAFIEQFENDAVTWRTGEEIKIDTWFEDVKGKLGTDPAGDLQLQINDLDTKTDGFIGKNTVISADGKTIEQVFGNKKIITEFASNSEIIEKLYLNNVLMHTKTTTISDDGLDITEVVI